MSFSTSSMVYTTATNCCLLAPPKQATNQPSRTKQAVNPTTTTAIICFAVYTWFALRGRRCALPGTPSRFFEPQCPPKRATNQQAKPSNQSTQLLATSAATICFAVYTWFAPSKTSNQPTRRTKQLPFLYQSTTSTKHKDKVSFPTSCMVYIQHTV